MYGGTNSNPPVESYQPFRCPVPGSEKCESFLQALHRNLPGQVFESHYHHICQSKAGIALIAEEVFVVYFMDVRKYTNGR